MQHPAVQNRADRVNRIVDLDEWPAMDRGRAGRGVHEPEQHPQRGRLPGAVRAQEADDPALVDGERQIVDGDDLAEVLGQSGDLDRVAHSRYPRFCQWTLPYSSTISW